MAANIRLKTKNGTISGKKIITINGNLFVCLSEVIGDVTTPSFLYMKKSGERFVSPKEIEWGKTPTSQAWGNAKDTWKDAKVLELTMDELKSAVQIKKQIAKNSTFGFTSEELKKHLNFIKQRSQNKVARPVMQ